MRQYRLFSSMAIGADIRPEDVVTEIIKPRHLTEDSVRVEVGWWVFQCIIAHSRTDSRVHWVQDSTVGEMHESGRDSGLRILGCAVIPHSGIKGNQVNYNIPVEYKESTKSKLRGVIAMLKELEREL